MGHSNNKINKDGGLCPIRDVSIVLGLKTPSGDWGYLCSNAHGCTNKWAKYKPEAIGTQADLTLEQRKANNFGLDPVGALASDGYTYNLAEWRYIAPGSGHWKRLGDFIDYLHTAKPPVYILSDEADIDGCTVVTWDEGITAIDDFKILAGFKTTSGSVGPPAQIEIGIDELTWGVSGGIGNCTFGLLMTNATLKETRYLGASAKFAYGSGEAPACRFNTRLAPNAPYNYITQALQNTAVGEYIEVLPVIDTMDFSANKISKPNSGLYGFPVGKKLRIYHRKSDDFYLTALSNMTLFNPSGTSLGTIHLHPGASLTDGIARYITDNTALNYTIRASYTFKNNRSYPVTLNAAGFYLNIANGTVIGNGSGIQASASMAQGMKQSITLAANSTTVVLIDFLVNVIEFNEKFTYVTAPSVGIPVQSSIMQLGYGSSTRLMSLKDTNGNLVTDNWLYGFRITS